MNAKDVYDEWLDETYSASTMLKESNEELYNIYFDDWLNGVKLKDIEE